MSKHEELTEMIQILSDAKDKGIEQSSIVSSLNIILSLRIPMQMCAMSASSGRVVCTAGTDFLLTHLRREKALLEN